jgi:hypothetical protein
MKHHPHHTFADLREAIFAPPPAKRARNGRTEMKVAGNPDVFKEAEGEEDYAKGDERKKSGRAKHHRKDGGAVHRMVGGPVKARADRRSRRKFADGGAADDGATQPTAAAATPSTSWLPPRAAAFAQGAGRLNDAATAIGRGVGAGLTAIDRELMTGIKPAYRAGGRVRKFASGGAATDDDQAKRTPPPIDDYDGGSDQSNKGAHAGYAAGIVDAFHRFMNETQGIRPAYAAGGRRTKGKQT